MKQKLRYHLLKLVLPVSLLVFGCSEKQELDSLKPLDISEDIGGASLKIVSNRVVFNDLESFLKVRDIILWNKNSDELDVWEKKVGFQSMRHLDLNEDSTNTLVKFGFPSSYAAIINNDGEYQIADKIYWFNNGFKYVASSEEELKSIKANPELVTNKFQAGIKLVETSKHSLSSRDAEQINLTTYNGSQSNGDRKYISPVFPFSGDMGSARRFVIETYIYTEDVSGLARPIPYLPVPYRTWYAALVLREHLEYYSFGRRSWKTETGQQRRLTYRLYSTATVSGLPETSSSGTSLPSSYPIFDNESSPITVTNSGNDFNLNLARFYLYSSTGAGRSSFNVNFQITGDIAASVDGDTQYYTYGLSGFPTSPLW